MGIRIIPREWHPPYPRPTHTLHGPGYRMAAPRTGTRYSNMAAEIDGGNCFSTYGPSLDYVDTDGTCILKQSPQVLPAPVTDYKVGDRVSKQFPNTCGPYPEVPGMGCGEAVTNFEGTITGNVSDRVENGIKVGQDFEVEWDMKPGMPTYPMFTYENPTNMFLVSRSMVSSAPTSQADCREGETFVEAVFPPCAANERCMAVTPAYCQGPTGDITPTTAGTTTKSILPILIIGGLMYYLYTKDK